MARLTSLAAILATILLLVANTYAIRTTISTVEIAEATNLGQTLPRCRKQILSGGYYPTFCMLYIIRSPVKMDYETMCCTQMRSLDDECHCEALGQLLVDLKVSGGEQVDMEDAEERAKNIPEYCNLKERCRIHIM